jgi:hypothetical protein
MPPKTSSRRRSEPKLFRCTGFGDCNMVFTRSEHLARHARKHTGEKPFKCIVPGCERMFSRFDNMMQHTRTHDRSQRKQKSESKTHTSSSDLPGADYAPYREPSPYQESYQPPAQQQQRRHSMIQTLTLPPVLPPTNSPSMPTTPQGYTSSSSYFSHVPPPPPSSFGHMSPLSPVRTRRLSSMDLQLPIQGLSLSAASGSSTTNSSGDEDNMTDENVDVTSDEYEALQGIGKFHTHVSLNEDPIQSNSPNIASQLQLFRHHAMPVPESYQRPSRHLK